MSRPPAALRGRAGTQGGVGDTLHQPVMAALFVELLVELKCTELYG